MDSMLIIVRFKILKKVKKMIKIFLVLEPNNI